MVQAATQNFSHSQDELRELAGVVLDHARAEGASACEVDVSEGFGQSVSVRRQEVETLGIQPRQGHGRNGLSRSAPRSCQ